MKIIDIYTGEIIEVLSKDYPGKYWTTRKAWADYKQAIKEYESSEDYKSMTRRMLYG